MANEKRLIDANALLEEHCGDCSLPQREMCKNDPVCGSAMWIIEAPTVDAVEVVRCKDCKYYREGKIWEGVKFCFRLRGNDGEPVGYNFCDDDFCSRGERRNDG